MATVDNSISAKTPYSRLDLIWVIAHMSAKMLLGTEAVDRINLALEEKDEAYLKSVWPGVLDTFLKDRDIQLDFTLRQAFLMTDFTATTDGAGREINTTKAQRRKRDEDEERKAAEDVLKKL